MDLRPLADKVNAWLSSGEGQALKDSLKEGYIELLSYRCGHYCRVYELHRTGLMEDFYPVVQPTRKGEDRVEMSDMRWILEQMWNEGSFSSLEELETFIWGKLKRH